MSKPISTSARIADRHHVNKMIGLVPGRCLQSREELHTLLVAIVLLAFFFISPKAVDSKTTVAISSASHHAHDGRVTQHLKSHKEMTESIDGDKEDRVSLIDFAQLAKDNELPDETDRKSVLESRSQEARGSSSPQAPRRPTVGGGTPIPCICLS